MFRAAYATCIFAAAITASSASCMAQEINIDALLKDYQSLESVSCSVRKTSKAGGQTVLMLSRVHFKRGGFIHVENVSPSKRRIIADGEKLYYHAANASKGFSKPVAELDDDWTSSLITVPGSPVDHLVKMKSMKPGEQKKNGDLRVKAFHGDKNHVVLTMDSKGRILSLEFFKNADLKERYASYKYSDFIEAGSTWLALKHEAEIMFPDGSKATEAKQFDNLSVNSALPDKLFDHSLFMQDLEFTSDFLESLK
jgi:outer membrane lipoprotein-sorting protein